MSTWEWFGQLSDLCVYSGTSITVTFRTQLYRGDLYTTTAILSENQKGVLSTSLPFEHSQTMKFTQQQKLIGLAFHSRCTTDRLWPLIRLSE